MTPEGHGLIFQSVQGRKISSVQDVTSYNPNIMLFFVRPLCGLDYFEFFDGGTLLNSPAPGALPVLPGPGVPDVFVTHIGCECARKPPKTIRRRWSQYGKGSAVFVNRRSQVEQERRLYLIVNKSTNRN